MGSGGTYVPSRVRHVELVFPMFIYGPEFGIEVWKRQAFRVPRGDFLSKWRVRPVMIIERLDPKKSIEGGRVGVGMVNIMPFRLV